MKNKYSTALYALVSLMAIAQIACSGPSAPTATKGKNPGDPSSAANVNGNNGDSAVLRKVDPRSKLSVFELDDAILRINGLRVGLQDYMASTSPAVTFLMPENGDYVEVLRCRADTIIRGTFDTLIDVDLGTPSQSEETKIMMSNNFWEAASTANGCLLVLSGFSDKAYIDNFALTGNYRYVMRACVDPNRLTDKELVTNRNCSKQVAISPVLNNFVNKRVQKETDALTLAAKYRDTVDGKGRQIYYLTVEMNNNLVECQSREISRQVSLKKRKAMTTLIGTGLAFAAKLTLTDPGASSVVKDATGAEKLVQPSFTDKFKTAWSNKDAIAGEGAQFGSVLNDLFSSPADFERSCTSAEKNRKDIETVAAQLKSAHEMWAHAMDDADAAKKSRIGLEK